MSTVLLCNTMSYINKMKHSVLLIFLLPLGLLIGCKSNPTSTSSSLTSMVQKINDGRPYTNILVYASSGNEFYGPSQNPFSDAYAKNGYLEVILKNNSISYFNLSSVHEIDIYNGNLYLKFN